jgi:hypothetical protein
LFFLATLKSLWAANLLTALLFGAENLLALKGTAELTPLLLFSAPLT